MLAPPHPRRQCCRGKPWEAYDSFMLHLTLTQHCRWGAGCIFNRSLNAAGAKFQKLKPVAGAVFQKQIWHVNRWETQYIRSTAWPLHSLNLWQAQFFSSKHGHLTSAVFQEQTWPLPGLNEPVARAVSQKQNMATTQLNPWQVFDKQTWPSHSLNQLKP